MMNEKTTTSRAGNRSGGRMSQILNQRIEKVGSKRLIREVMTEIVRFMTEARVHAFMIW